MLVNSVVDLNTGRLLPTSRRVDVDELFLTHGNRIIRVTIFREDLSRCGLQLWAVYSSDRDKNRDQSLNSQETKGKGSFRMTMSHRDGHGSCQQSFFPF